MLIEPSKTEGLVISLDPRETLSKTQPPLQLENTHVPFKKHFKIPGVNIDTQYRFTEHTNIMAKKRRTQLLSRLSGKNWCLTFTDLRRLYNSMSSQEHFTPVKSGVLFSPDQFGSSSRSATIELQELLVTCEQIPMQLQFL